MHIFLDEEEIQRQQYRKRPCEIKIERNEAKLEIKIYSIHTWTDCMQFVLSSQCTLYNIFSSHFAAAAGSNCVLSSRSFRL